MWAAPEPRARTSCLREYGRKMQHSFNQDLRSPPPPSAPSSWPASLRASSPLCGSCAIRAKRMPRLLELFSGTGSIGSTFEAEGWEVAWTPNFGPP